MTLIAEVIFSGFVSKAVNNCVDVSWNKIKDAVKNRKAKYQNLESQIYCIIVDVLNKITYFQFENNQDNIYDAAEVLLKSFHGNEGENITSCLQTLHLTIDENKYNEFKNLVYEELGQDIYSELYRSILLFQLEQKNHYDNIVYEQLIQKLEEIERKIDKLNLKLEDTQNGNDEIVLQNNVVKFQNNKKEEYLKLWNSRMFLHMDDDENPITLADAFITPDYKIYRSVKKIGFTINDTLDEIIRKFAKFEKTSTMLFTGEPGIGKSSIISWIANQNKEDDRFIILRFFGWKKEELKDGLLNAICNILKCQNEDLENKILILDGFDEMKTLSIRDELLSTFFLDIKDFENFKCIITSRPTYIESKDFSNVIRILPFKNKDIEDFYGVIKNTTLICGKICNDNLEVLGIPVILYMAIMSNIDINENHTKPELYNRIFAKKNGIFDRFSDGDVGYGKGKQIIRDPQNIECYLSFLRKVAFDMFKKNEVVLQKNECEIPLLEFEGEYVSIIEFPIKHFFESVETNIEFIHRSIYEFFVSEYIYYTIYNEIDESEDKVAKVLGNIFQVNIIEKEMLEFLQYRFRRCNKMKSKLFKLICTFELMMQNGMIYYADTKEKETIESEMRTFSNILRVLHLWEFELLSINSSGISYYLRINNDCLRVNEFDLRKFDLSGIELQKANLTGIDLSGANLSGAILTGADMRKVQLVDTILNGADMRKADLSEANLKRAKLIGANLRCSKLWRTNLKKADLRGAKLSRVNLAEARLRGAILYQRQVIHLKNSYDLSGVLIRVDEFDEML